MRNATTPRGGERTTLVSEVETARHTLTAVRPDGGEFQVHAARIRDCRTRMSGTASHRVDTRLLPRAVTLTAPKAGPLTWRGVKEGSG